MSSENSTSSYSPSSEVLSICRLFGELNNPSKATSTSITTSLSAIIITALTFPLAAFLNALILVGFYKNSSLRKRSKVAVTCCILGFCLTLIRSFTEKAQFLVMLLFLSTFVAMLVFSVLIWRTIKKGNEQFKVHFCQPGQAGSQPDTDHEVRVCTPIRVKWPSQSSKSLSPKDVNMPDVFSSKGAGQKESESKAESQDRNIIESDTERHVCRISISERSNSAENIQTRHVNGQPVNSQPFSKNIHGAMLTKSERKAAQVVTYLAMGLLFTRLPQLIFPVLVSGNMELMSVLAPLMQSLRLMASLADPLIVIAANNDIREACLKLVKCWNSKEILADSTKK
ncbi:hypothetical protein AC249_AIPGENE7344 [Exaiptasia diaphana]|nr:hypothetical protein AC249_AIPGENE7344 [Exaiptasia diaphana]